MKRRSLIDQGQTKHSRTSSGSKQIKIAEIYLSIDGLQRTMPSSYLVFAGFQRDCIAETSHAHESIVKASTLLGSQCEIEFSHRARVGGVSVDEGKSGGGNWKTRSTRERLSTFSHATKSDFLHPST